MKKLLITRPNHDDATYYLYHWSQEIIKMAEERGIKVFDLSQEKANKKYFTSYMNSHNPKFVILNGHGTSNKILGYKDEVLIEENKNEDILKEKIVYTIACEAAKSLGEKSVAKGCSCFIGYKEKFVFFIDERSFTNPTKDRIAKSFFVSTNKIPILIIKGNNCGEAIERAREEFRKQILKWRQSSEMEAPFIINALLMDLISLTLIGNELERLE